MLKRTIKYVDYKGTEREEDFYFNLSKPEVVELQLATKGGLSEYLERITKAQVKSDLIKWFKKIILLAYGEKSDDGRRFIKSEEISTAFSQTEAFSILYMELIQDEEKAAEFINAIIPEFPELNDEVVADNTPNLTVAK